MHTTTLRETAVSTIGAVTQAGDPLWTPKQTADYLGMSTGTLANYRSRGESPIPFCRIGSRIRYRASDVHAYVMERTVAA